MILVDTSALIAFLEGVESHAAGRLKIVLRERIPFGINPLIFQEVLQGARSESEHDTLQKYLCTQKFYHPLDPVDSFTQAARIYFLCRRNGITVRSTIDCQIAQTGIEHNLLLLHDDRDYEQMASVIPLRFY